MICKITDRNLSSCMSITLQHETSRIFLTCFQHKKSPGTGGFLFAFFIEIYFADSLLNCNIHSYIFFPSHSLVAGLVALLQASCPPLAQIVYLAGMAGLNE